MGPIRLEWGGPIPVRCTPPFCAECGALKRRGGGRAPTRTSRQWRFVLRQATFGQLYTKGCRICASYRRRRYQGGLRGGNHQHRNEFLFSPPENPRVRAERWAHPGPGDLSPMIITCRSVKVYFYLSLRFPDSNTWHSKSGVPSLAYSTSGPIQVFIIKNLKYSSTF